MGSSQVWVPRCDGKAKAAVSKPLSSGYGYSTRSPGLPFLSQGYGLRERLSSSPTGKSLPGLKARSPCFQFGYQPWVTLGKFFSLDLGAGTSLLSRRGSKTWEATWRAFREIFFLPTG